MRKNIETAIDNLEDNEKLRSTERKSILMREVKHILDNLQDVEKKAVKDIKKEVFDFNQVLNKITSKVDNLRSSLKSYTNNSNVGLEIQALKSEVSCLEYKKLLESLDVCVSSSYAAMFKIKESFPDAIFLKSQYLDPAHFQLEVYERDPAFVIMKIYIVRDHSSLSFDSSLLQKMIEVSMYTTNGLCEFNRIVEENSLHQKITAKLGFVSDDKGHVSLKMEHHQASVVKVCVRILGSNIKKSPIFHEFTFNNEGRTNSNVTAGIGDETLLAFNSSELDYCHLDSTKSQPLRNFQHKQDIDLKIKYHSKTNVPFYPQPSLAFTKIDNPMTVQNQLLQSIQFSPLKDDTVSTMNCTVGSALARELEKVKVGQELDCDEESDAQIKRENVAVFINDCDAYKLSDITEVFSSISNNDGLKELGDNSSRLEKSPTSVPEEKENAMEHDVWDYSEETEEGDDHCAETLPIIQTHGISTLEKKELMKDEPLCTGADDENSIDGLLEDDDEEELYVNHPHFLLNASMVPVPRADWSIADPSWDLNSSVIPEQYLQNFSRVNQASPFANQTLWDISPQAEIIDGKNFDFQHRDFVLEEIYSSFRVSKRKFSQYCLKSPHSIAFLPKMELFLVSEPNQNRLGLYFPNKFEFCDWLKYPVYGKHRPRPKKFWTYPTHLLSMSCGHFAVIEHNKLHVFNAFMCPLQYINGVFFGLTEGPNEEILTIEKERDSEQLFIIKYVTTEKGYRWNSSINIYVHQEFDNWKTLSRARFLVQKDGKVFISDQGLHKIYVVDLANGDQKVWGYLGSNPGQINGPLGMLTDDMGNLLIGDRGNNCLQVFRSNGNAVKIINDFDFKCMSPYGLYRCMDGNVYVVFMGKEEGAVAKFSLKSSV